MVAAFASPVPEAVPLTIAAVDGVPLGAHHLRPTGLARGAVLIVPAMGVPQRFYGEFATWLATRGFHVLTFDYRGMGASRTAPLRSLAATDIVTWAQLDVTAALRALQDRAGDVPLTWVGHSLGGQIVPFVPDHIELAKIVTIASGSGYIAHNPLATRRKAYAYWYVVAPLATALWGYFPGRTLRLVDDLPSGVVRQWRRWCLHPDYAVGVEGPDVARRFAAVRTPIASISFADDEILTAASITGLHRHYTSAPRTAHHLAPGDVGLERIGHFGAFRPAMRDALWEPVILPELAT
jgi:predicted alpha/beta hydrolase